MFILGIVLAGNCDVKASKNQELFKVDVLQNKSPLKANIIDISSHQKAVDIDLNK